MSERFDQETGEIIETLRNLRHWNKLETTDPKHTKPFQRAGGFRGTAIKPIWNQYRLTEHFGPCGVGWGTDEPKFTTFEIGGEMMVFCTLRCWYMDDDGKRAELYGIGGDKVLQKRQSGVVTDDEAFKKAFTDALGNAFLRLGVSADVHMGLFEDSKYVEHARALYEPTPPTPAPAAAPVVTKAPPARPTPARAGSRAAQSASSATGDPQEPARAAYKRLQIAIAQASKHSPEALRLVCDGVEWGKEFRADAELVANASLESIIKLQDYARDELMPAVVTEADADNVLMKMRTGA